MITTSNLYFAGFLLTSEAKLVQVETALNEKQNRYVVFHFSTGSESADEELSKEYEMKTAQVNIREFVENYIRAKDIVYRMKDERESNVHHERFNESADGGNYGRTRSKRNACRN